MSCRNVSLDSYRACPQASYDHQVDPESTSPSMFQSMRYASRSPCGPPMTPCHATVIVAFSYSQRPSGDSSSQIRTWQLTIIRSPTAIDGGITVHSGSNSTVTWKDAGNSPSFSKVECFSLRKMPPSEARIQVVELSERTVSGQCQSVNISSRRAKTVVPRHWIVSSRTTSEADSTDALPASVCVHPMVMPESPTATRDTAPDKSRPWRQPPRMVIVTAKVVRTIGKR